MTIPAAAAWGHPGGVKNQIDDPPTPIIMVKDTPFTLRVTQRFLSQSASIGPNTLLSISHWCSRGEDFAKQAAASSTKGVVGNKGSATPIAASKSSNKPIRVQGFKATVCS